MKRGANNSRQQNNNKKTKKSTTSTQTPPPEVIYECNLPVFENECRKNINEIVVEQKEIDI